MRHWRNHRISRAAVLLAIREGSAKSFDKLEQLFIPTSTPPSTRCMLERDIYVMVDDFVKAGLLDSPEISSGYLKTTALLGKIQTALEISLNELSQVDAEAISVSPLFGAPVLQDDFPEVFVLMPFSNELKPVFEDHIRLVVKELGFSVGRADDFFGARSIISDIWHAIYFSKILIADCTTRNPNVFYEIGVAHTVGKPTIVITQSIDDVPFDLQHLRCIVYEYTPRGMASFNDTLRKTVETEMRLLTQS